MSRAGHRLPPTSKRQRPAQPSSSDIPPATQSSQHNKSAPAQHNIVLLKDSNFSLNEYINQYTGTTRIYRLLHIAQHCTQLAHDALLQAVTEIKQHRYNVILYNEAISVAQSVLSSAQLQANPAFTYDKPYIDTLTRASNQQLNKLEHQYNAAKKDGERDVLRTALLQLAEYYASTGDYNNAISKYLECREYVPADDLQQQYAIISAVIKCSVDTQTLIHVKNQVQRARTLSTITNDAAVNAYLYAVSGLYALKNESAATAVEQFIHVTTALGTTYNNVTVLRDIAMYTALCALASYNRKQLKQHILNNTEYQKLLDRTPEWRQILDHYYSNNHNAYMQQLQQLQPVLELDIYIGTHVSKLYQQIRDTAIVNYILPYSNVRMSDMCAAFGMSLDTLELTVATLIKQNKLHARIDAVNNIVYTVQQDVRRDTFDKTLAAGERYIADVQNMLLRYNLLDQEIVVGDMKQQPAKPGKTRKQQAEVRNTGSVAD